MRACYENFSDFPQPCYKNINCEECRNVRVERESGMFHPLKKHERPLPPRIPAPQHLDKGETHELSL